MANREACELLIEQEIDEGLKKGKTPYSIGKELSGWVAELFEVRISPHTIQSIAHRQQQKEVNSSELKESQLPENIQDSTPKIIKDRQPQGGGKREGAGRPKDFEKLHGKLTHKISEIKKIIEDMAVLRGWREEQSRILNEAQGIVYFIHDRKKGGINATN